MVLPLCGSYVQLIETLQLAEKGACMGIAVGIDLGTTNSAVSVVRPTGKPEVLKNKEGDSITPSVVLFQSFGGPDEPLVGEQAKRQAAAFPDDIVQHVKRYMGDPSWRFDSSSGAQYSAEEVSAIILKRLKEDAEIALGEEVTDAVITVPAYFDDARRTATKQAGQIAGLNVLRVLNEPTAAALSYGIDADANGTVLVYDLGGGTFDVTILKIAGTEFEVIATDGDRNLGGFDFDNALMSYLNEELKKQGAPDALEDIALMASLREKAEFAKKALSTVPKTNVQFSANDQHYRVPLTREEFIEVTQSLMVRTQELVADVLEASKLTWDDIDKVLLVGGSTRMPAVRELVEQMSGKSPELDVNPDEAVALGAAIQATLEGDIEVSTEQVGSKATVESFLGGPVHISDVTSQALGVILIEADGVTEFNQVMIERNTKVPAKTELKTKTAYDRQTAVHVKVTQGDGRDPQNVTIVGEGQLEIPVYPKGSPLRVSYEYDVDQTVVVEVYDLTANKSLGTIKIERVANLGEGELGEMEQKIGGMQIN